MDNTENSSNRQASSTIPDGALAVPGLDVVGARIAAVVGEQLGQRMIGQQIAEEAARNLAQAHGSASMAMARIGEVIRQNQPAMQRAAAAIADTLAAAGFQQRVMAGVVADSGLAETLARATAQLDLSGVVGGNAYLSVVRALDETYSPHGENVDEDLPAIPEGLIGELEEPARAFATTQGRGMSWEEQRRLFYWFVSVVVFLLSLQAVVENESLKELAEDSAVPAALATAAGTAANRSWDRMVPRPPGDSAGDGPDSE
ncbi:hypothetical protein [Streptomyces sp. NPDC095613]|uniref:hypothetical protein n=1 Tax=Streptomyces sp. NPDC095613 TaxID=3155540 RepID=UPI0033276B4A